MEIAFSQLTLLSSTPRLHLLPVGVVVAPVTYVAAMPARLAEAQL